jgi:hypothetical protein
MSAPECLQENRDIQVANMVEDENHRVITRLSGLIYIMMVHSPEEHGSIRPENTYPVNKVSPARGTHQTGQNYEREKREHEDHEYQHRINTI